MLVSLKARLNVSPPLTVKVCVLSEQLAELPSVVTEQVMAVAAEFLYTLTVEVSVTSGEVKLLTPRLKAITVQAAGTTTKFESVESAMPVFSPDCRLIEALGGM